MSVTAHYRAELADSRMLHNTHTHQIEETRQQTADNIEEKKVLQVKCENAKVRETWTKLLICGHQHVIFYYVSTTSPNFRVVNGLTPKFVLGDSLRFWHGCFKTSTAKSLYSSNQRSAPLIFSKNIDMNLLYKFCWLSTQLPLHSHSVITMCYCVSGVIPELACHFHWQLQKYDSISSLQNLDLMVHKLLVTKILN